MKNATVPKNMIISLHDITFFNIVASGSESPTTDIIKAIAVPNGTAYQLSCVTTKLHQGYNLATKVSRQ